MAGITVALRCSPVIQGTGYRISLPRYTIPSALIGGLLKEAGIVAHSYAKTTADHDWFVSSGDADNFRDFLRKKFSSPRAFRLWVTAEKEKYKQSKPWQERTETAATLLPGSTAAAAEVSPADLVELRPATEVADKGFCSVCNSDPCLKLFWCEAAAANNYIG